MPKIANAKHAHITRDDRPLCECEIGPNGLLGPDSPVPIELRSCCFSSIAAAKRAKVEMQKHRANLKVVEGFCPTSHDIETSDPGPTEIVDGAEGVEPVGEVFPPEQIEPEAVSSPAPFGLGDDLLAEIFAHADDAAEAKAQAKATEKAAGPAPRRGLAKAMFDAVNEGRVPDKLVFPASNKWSQVKADRLHELAVAGDAAGIMAFQIGGTNTYSKLLRLYRDACLELLIGSDPMGAAMGSGE